MYMYVIKYTLVSNRSNKMRPSLIFSISHWADESLALSLLIDS